MVKDLVDILNKHSNYTCPECGHYSDQDYEVFERDDDEPVPDDVLTCCICGKSFI